MPRRSPPRSLPLFAIEENAEANFQTEFKVARAKSVSMIQVSSVKPPVPVPVPPNDSRWALASGASASKDKAPVLKIRRNESASLAIQMAPPRLPRDSLIKLNDLYSTEEVSCYRSLPDLLSEALDI